MDREIFTTFKILVLMSIAGIGAVGVVIYLLFRLVSMAVRYLEYLGV